MKFEVRYALDDSSTRLTDDGYLVTSALIARTGIQQYSGQDVGLSDSTVNVYRPEDAVFSTKSMASMANRPITVDHPSEAVTSKNWRELAVGQTGGEVARDGDFIRVPLIIMDEAAIAAVQAGKRELSVGYSCEIVVEDGVAPDGTPYKARQSEIIANHLAIVDAARAGRNARIPDGNKRNPSNQKDKEPEMTLKTVVVDGLSVETTDAGAQAIDKLQKDITTKDAAIQARDKEIAELKVARVKDADDHKAEIATKDAEHKAAIEKKDGEIAATKAQIPDAAALEKLAADRADAISKAKTVFPGVVTDGKSLADIQRQVVTHKLGDAAKDWSEATVEGAYLTLTADVKPTDRLQDGFRRTSPTTQANDASNAYEERLKQDSAAWKGEAA